MTDEDFQKLVEAELALTDLYLKTEARKPIHAFVLHLRSLLRKTEDRFHGHPMFPKLLEVQQLIQNKEEALKAAQS